MPAAPDKSTVSGTPGPSRAAMNAGMGELYDYLIGMFGSTGVPATAFNAIKQAASETATGVVEMATTAEAAAGADTTRAVTAAGVEAHMNANELGWGQTWQSLANSQGVTYTNNTGRPIAVAIAGIVNPTGTLILTIGGGNRQAVNNPSASAATLSVFGIVPHGVTYSVSGAGGGLSVWNELR